MTDTTIQYKERSDEFQRLRRILDSSRSLDDFLDTVNEGISVRSRGISGLTAAGRRSLAEWYRYRNSERFVEVPIRGTISQIIIKRTFVRVGGNTYVKYRNEKTGRFVSNASGIAVYRLMRQRVMQ